MSSSTATQDNSKHAIVLIDSDTTSLTISWPEVPRARRYALEYTDATTNETNAYTVLSDKLTSTQARKRNLDPKHGPFTFRVRARDEVDFIGEMMTSDELNLLSEDEANSRMEAPLATAVGNCCAHVQWKKAHDNTFELQMREVQGGAAWQTIATSLKNTEARKRNLTSSALYQFRVRPNTTDSSDGNIPFSPPSNQVQALSISPGLARLFPRGGDGAMLLTKNNTAMTSMKLADALAGKVTMLYFSAHWCGPCRQFTPQLANYYNALKKSSNNVEVVFVSLDHDESSFNSYYKSMPWLAVPFDEDDHGNNVREDLQGRFSVNGIPRLVVLNAQGSVVEENAVGKDLNSILIRANSAI
uniref:protein-disulfide reductase n=1 Tax=Ditylum brightwellii TaxID=49249 RepID=A0A7S4UKE2_9STRA